MSAEELRNAPGQDPRPKRPGTPLTPVDLSREDTELLHLVDEVGAEYTVEIDLHLRAILRGPDDTPADPGGGQSTMPAPHTLVEKKMESTLRPRDIQNRIRSGESPESVAEAAGTSVDRIMAFAAPVLAEREHVAQSAQRSSVRRRGGEGARTLGLAVESWLGARKVRPETVEWDAWRREDGKWMLTASYICAERKGTAEFTYDQRGSFVTLDNDDARWLVGDLPPEPPARNDLAEARARRDYPADEHQLTIDDGALGDDAIGIVRADAAATAHSPESAQRTDATATAEAATADLTETAARIRGLELGEEAPVEAYLDTPAKPTAEPKARPAEHPATSERDTDEPTEKPTEEPKKKPARKNRGRASVPSWDEIMFGGGKPE